MCIFCAETVKTYGTASEYIFYVSANVWLLLGVFQYFLMNVRLLLKDINEQLFNVQVILFFCVADSRNISMFFNERAAAREKILTTAFEIYLLQEKMCDCFLELCPLKKLF